MTLERNARFLLCINFIFFSIAHKFYLFIFGASVVHVLLFRAVVRVFNFASLTKIEEINKFNIITMEKEE